MKNSKDKRPKSCARNIKGDENLLEDSAKVGSFNSKAETVFEAKSLLARN